MLYSAVLGIGLSAAISVLSYNALVERSEKVRTISAVAPLLLDLERYRSAQCQEGLPPTATPAELIAGGAIDRDYAQSIFPWIFESGANNTASLVITSTDTGLLGSIRTVYQGTDHPLRPNSITVAISAGKQMSIPDLHTNVINEIGNTNRGCL